MAKRSKKQRRDLLSDLPLSIIHIILGLVPIRDAVKTSILSRQWRYIWATLSNLDFHDRSASEKTSLDHFITQALFLHKGPIHSFRLTIHESRCIDQWLLSLSRNDIRMLILQSFRVSHRLRIHSSVYSCEKLTHLDLLNCDIPSSPPTFNGFLSLRRLFLMNVEVPCKAIESIFANSPLLEKVSLDGNKYSGTLEWRIHAPNLKYFFIYSRECIEISFYAPLLSKLSLILYSDEFTPKHLQQKSSVCNYVKLLDSFTKLEKLRLQGDFIKFLRGDVEYSIVFRHLRFIHIFPWRFNDVKNVWMVVRLIMCAPNLEKLIIMFEHYVFERTQDVAGISFWDSEDASNFIFERLKVIEMCFAHGMLNEMKLLKFLLASSPVLETLRFESSSLVKDDHILVNLRSELLSYRRGSPNAQITVR